MFTKGETNDSILFSLTSLVFLLILITRVFSERGTRNNPEFVKGSARFCGEGGMVYAEMSANGPTDLHIIPNGSITGQRYRDEILRPIKVPYDAGIGDGFMLMIGMHQIFGIYSVFGLFDHVTDGQTEYQTIRYAEYSAWPRIKLFGLPNIREYLKKAFKTYFIKTLYNFYV